MKTYAFIYVTLASILAFVGVPMVASLQALFAKV
jgi:hypothetical protein